MTCSRPTVATLVLAVIGTMTTVQILRTDHHNVDARPTRVVIVTARAAAAPGLWSHQPGHLTSAEPAAWIADSAQLLAARPTMAMPDGSRMVPPRPSALVAATARSADITVVERGAAAASALVIPARTVSRDALNAML